MKRHERITGAVTAALICCTGIAWRAWADDSDVAQRAQKLEQAKLAGLNGVYVLVETMDSDAERDGLTRAQVQTDAELRLRKAGVKVLNKKESFAAPGAPYLYIQVDMHKLGQHMQYDYSIDVALREQVRLVRNLEIRCDAQTWDAPGSFGSISQSRIREIRDIVNDRVDEFINAYLAANPPVPASQPARP